MKLVFSIWKKMQFLYNFHGPNQPKPDPVALINIANKGKMSGGAKMATL